MDAWCLVLLAPDIPYPLVGAETEHEEHLVGHTKVSKYDDKNCQLSHAPQANHGPMFQGGGHSGARGYVF